MDCLSQRNTQVWAHRFSQRLSVPTASSHPSCQPHVSQWSRKSAHDIVRAASQQTGFMAAAFPHPPRGISVCEVLTRFAERDAATFRSCSIVSGVRSRPVFREVVVPTRDLVCGSSNHVGLCMFQRRCPSLCNRDPHIGFASLCPRRRHECAT